MTRLPEHTAIIKAALAQPRKLELLPDKAIEIYIDEQYIMASLGVMSLQYKDAARKLLRSSLRLSLGEDKNE